MTHELRKLLEEELAGEAPPPLGDMVQVSVSAGRRVRRRRRLLAGAGGGVTAVVLAVAGVFALGTLKTGAEDAPTGRTGPEMIAAEPIATAPVARPVESTPPRDCAVVLLPSASAPASPGTTVKPEPDAGDLKERLAAEASAGGSDEPEASVAPTVQDTPCPPQVGRLDLSVPSAEATGGEFATTTPEAALELFTRLLPKEAVTSDFAAGKLTGGADPGSVLVQLVVDQGEGPELVRLYLGNDAVGFDGVCAPTEACYDVAGVGQIAIAADGASCISARSVTLRRDDGVLIALNLGDCLTGAKFSRPPDTLPLSTQEAVTIALNPTWGTTMPFSLVKTADTRFPQLSPILGG